MNFFKINALAFTFLIATSFQVFAQDTKSNVLSAKLFTELPNYCPTPEAFDIAPDGSLTLSCPN